MKTPAAMLKRLLPLIACFCLAAPLSAADNKIVPIAGPPSHGPGELEFNAGVLLCKNVSTACRARRSRSIATAAIWRDLESNVVCARRVLSCSHGNLCRRGNNHVLRPLSERRAALRRADDSRRWRRADGHCRHPLFQGERFRATTPWHRAGTCWSVSFALTCGKVIL